KKCKQKHLSVMCPQSGKPIKMKGDAVLSGLSCSGEVILQTLKVNILHGNQKSEVRALFDNGSQRSYILERTANTLGLRFTRKVDILHELFGGTQEYKKHGLYQINVESLSGEFGTKLTVMDHEKICNKLPRMDKGAWLKELKNKKIWLTDIGTNYPDIELLIGADYFGGLDVGNVCKLKNGLTARQTKL